MASHIDPLSASSLESSAAYSGSLCSGYSSVAPCAQTLAHVPQRGRARARGGGQEDIDGAGKRADQETPAAPGRVSVAQPASSPYANGATGFSRVSANGYMPIPVSVTRPPMANAPQARHTGVPSLAVRAGAHPHVHGIGAAGEDGQHARTHEDDCATCRQIRELQRQHEAHYANDDGAESPARGSAHPPSSSHSPALYAPPVVTSPSPRRNSEDAFSPADRLSHIASVAAEAFPDVPPLSQSPPSPAPPPRRSTPGAASPPPPSQVNDAPPAYTPIASP
ncbi:uncharacterized protein BXZ73DRAFT_80021 [Epithele typhae]|uniref:uncharacterized protein n=1 Tax=Epithele typhae TaxID=378194 RepID=UPI0020086720|nr:uncharacterized protein BXZ73DRAFT_80021 [Epithele typhae]KAH9921256.1 hypothetical protein BXZ73DRAFT_80021 [Epithele typhae]